MLLAFDIGNTTIAVGVFKGKKLLKDWRIKTDKEKTGDEYGIILLNLFQREGLESDGFEAADHLECRPAPDADLPGPSPRPLRTRGLARRAGPQDGHAHPL